VGGAGWTVGAAPLHCPEKGAPGGTGTARGLRAVEREIGLTPQAVRKRARRQLLRDLRRLAKRYPVASIARAVGVTPMAVHNKIK